MSIQPRLSTRPGRYGDGGGLSLLVSKTGRGYWQMRITIRGAAENETIGPADEMSLEEARERAEEIRRGARKGHNPVAEQRAARMRAVTFSDSFGEYFEVKAPQFTSQRHAKVWRRSIEQHVVPHIGEPPVDAITASEIIRLLVPVSRSNPLLATRLLQRMEAVFKSATLHGHRKLASPTIGVSDHLGLRNKPQVTHFRALPYQDVPRLMLKLREGRDVEHFCLRFILLTLVRSKEARETPWREITPGSTTWSVPGSDPITGRRRMKMGRPWDFPLSTAALELLDELRAAKISDEWLFPGQRSGRPLDPNRLTLTLKRIGLHDATVVHGLQSTVKTWCQGAGVPDEVSEAMLAHADGNRVRSAYLRTTFLEERRPVLEAWAHFCTGA